MQNGKYIGIIWEKSLDEASLRRRKARFCHWSRKTGTGNSSITMTFSSYSLLPSVHWLYLPNAEYVFFSHLTKKCPTTSPRFYSRWDLTWSLFQSLKSLEEWLPQFILRQKFTSWPVSYGQRDSPAVIWLLWLLSYDRNVEMGKAFP